MEKKVTVIGAGNVGATAAQRLAEKDIDTRPFFLGMHEQPVLRSIGLFRDQEYPIAERLARQGLYIPSGLTIKDEEIALVSEAVKDILSGH